MGDGPQLWEGEQRLGWVSGQRQGRGSRLTLLPPSPLATAHGGRACTLSGDSTAPAGVSLAQRRGLVLLCTPLSSVCVYSFHRFL